jgi:hypothetical protein
MSHCEIERGFCPAQPDQRCADDARERLPLVTAAEDTMLEVKDVLEVRVG